MAAKAEVVTVAEVEGVAEEEGAEVEGLKKQMLLLRIWMLNLMLTMKWYESCPC